MCSSDLLSQAFGGKDIQTILEELGEEKYVDTEARICIEHTKGRDNLVISPAGSSIYHQAWTDHLRDISSTIYLKVPFEMVEARLLKVPPRAIIGLGKKTLRQLYDERHPLYEKSSDLVLEPTKLSSDEALQAIVDFLNSKR